MDLQKLKIAIVYDWLDRWGGVERVLITLHEMFPGAHFYTSVFDKSKASWATGFPIYTSFMQRLPSFIKKSRILSLLFYPYAFESFDFSSYDLVLSVSSSFAKGVITKPGTKHICYLLTPSRYLWLYRHSSATRVPGPLYRCYNTYMQRWDRTASVRPDDMISISATVEKRCRDIYGRASGIIYPPFDTSYWGSVNPKKPDGMEDDIKNFYLVVSRLEPYKKVGIVIDAFNALKDKRVLVVGTGSLYPELREKAGPNISFLPSVTDGELKWLYLNAKGLIMPQEEDFGYVSVEAQYFGLPVIAYRAGGAKETVLEDKTGIFFDRQTVTALSSALARYDKISYNFRHGMPKLGQEQAQKYSKDAFTRMLTLYITNSLRKAE